MAFFPPAAHIQAQTGQEQTVREHSEQTAALAESFAIPPMRNTVRACGLFHDAGKFQESFQRRIHGAPLQAPHAPCGAQAVKAAYPPGFGRLMAEYVIAGHHAGLPDFGSRGDAPGDPTLCGILTRPSEDIGAYRAELTAPPLDENALRAFLAQDCATREDVADKFAFFTRYAYSCLTDADSLNTEAFETGRARETPRADFSACLARVQARLQSFQAETPLQRARAGLQAQAFARAGEAANVYLLNMPTGSSKTLCSLAFALERALRAHKRRLIFIIPYNSIIDQTAQTFEDLLGDDAVVLRHQSTWVYEDDRALREEEKLSRTQATENWDAPLLITTAVQFFESMYGDRRSRLRKLHNLQDAVLVFDEAHLLPRDYLQPCLKGIAYLTKYLNSEAVLLTATMPDYRALLARYALPGLRTVDLVPNREAFALFRKCRYRRLGALSDAALWERARQAPSCLMLVNSRQAARALYALCPLRRKYHLSTWMTALDRQRVIQAVRGALAELEARYPGLADVPDSEKIMVVSTSLVEAGVDFDFHTVLRELSGLDSILQAGGRCNREGRRPLAEVGVFERMESVGAAQPDARVSITRELLSQYDAPDDPACIEAYYARLYEAHEDALTFRSLANFAKREECFDERYPAQLPFRSYTRAFQLIDAPTCAVAVPCDGESRALIARIPAGLDARDRRRLQRYACSVSPGDFRSLAEQHRVQTDESGLSWLVRAEDYDPETGIRWECGDLYC